LFDNPLGEHRHAELDPAGMAGRAHLPLIDLHHLAAGLENPVLKRKTSAVFSFVFLGFLGFFGFLFLFLYICPEERRVFRVFSVSKILLGASRSY
jgi:hypothetical protein